MATVTGIELAAVLFGLACVWLTIRQNIWCWPTGLVQVILYVIIFYQVKLYSDLILHLVYIGMQIYGWHHWLYGGKNQEALPVSTLTSQQRGFWILIAGLITPLWGFGMAKYTDATFPYGDAFTTVASLIAQWLLAHKKLESWYFWIAVDVIAIGIYWQKNLVLAAGLYSVFLILAVIGLLAWRKAFSSNRSEAI